MRKIYILFILVLQVYVFAFELNINKNTNLENTLVRIFGIYGKYIPDDISIRKRKDANNTIYFEVMTQLKRIDNNEIYLRPIHLSFAIDGKTGEVDNILLQGLHEHYEVTSRKEDFVNLMVIKSPDLDNNDTKIEKCIISNLENQSKKNPIEYCGLLFHANNFRVVDLYLPKNNNLFTWCRQKTIKYFKGIKIAEVETIYGDLLYRISFSFNDGIEIYISTEQDIYGLEYRVEYIDGLQKLDSKTGLCVQEVFGSLPNNKRIENCRVKEKPNSKNIEEDIIFKF